MRPAVAATMAATPRFAAHVADAGGRHPIDLFMGLRDSAERTAEDDALFADARQTSAEPSILPQGDGLPLPHPLDAEWRFDTSTSDDLVVRAVDATRPGDAILLLGVPTVVMSALRSRVRRRFVVRCEANVVGAALSVRIADDERFVDAPPDGCGAAVLDPPWYPQVFDALVGQAAQACRSGAAILVGAPPAGVRPASPAERRSTLAAAQASGLVLVREETAVLGYRTPAFEVAAMRASGVGAWLPGWRRGDLLVLQKVSVGGELSLPPATPAFELTLDGVRLRLLAAPGPTGKAIEPIIAGEVFPSVSARASGRRRANLWTTGNRAFACDPAPTLIAMQQLAATRDLWPKGLDHGPKEVAASASIDAIQLVDELARIAARDLAQTATLVGESSWDRSANDARFLNGSSSAFHRNLLGTPA